MRQRGIDYSQLPEVIKIELLETIKKLDSSPSKIFSYIYKELDKKYRQIMGLQFDNVFQIRIMVQGDEKLYKEGQKYFTAGYFQKANNEAYVEFFPEFHITNVRFAGTSENPDLIVFQPKIKFAEGHTFTSHQNLSTVFEEFFHGAQNIFYTTPINLYEKEVEVEVAKAYEYYVKGWSDEFYNQTGLTFLKTSIIKGYFDKLLSKQLILIEEEKRFREAIVSIAKEKIYPAYKKYVTHQEMIDYKGTTLFFDKLVKY